MQKKPTGIDKNTAAEIVRELLPSGCSPVQLFAVELACARHRGRVLECVADYVRKCSKGTTITTTTNSPFVRLDSVRVEVRRILEELADRIAVGNEETER